MKQAGPRALPRAGLPAVGEVPAFPLSLAVKVHGKHTCACTHMYTCTYVHVHTQREGPHMITFPGALGPTVVCSCLIFLNQAAEPTRSQAGERKQMLAPPGRSELGRLSWRLNPRLRQDTAPCKM